MQRRPRRKYPRRDRWRRHCKWAVIVQLHDPLAAELQQGFPTRYFQRARQETTENPSHFSETTCKTEKITSPCFPQEHTYHPVEGSVKITSSWTRFGRLSRSRTFDREPCHRRMARCCKLPPTRSQISASAISPATWLPHTPTHIA